MALPDVIEVEYHFTSGLDDMSKARPQVADGGEGLQLWVEAANILRKQSWRADNGWSSILQHRGLDAGLTNPTLKIDLL
jgi:hypothetical protein